MAEAHWTPRMVEDRIEEAAFTLRRLPDPRLQQARSSWPPIIHEFHDAYGAEPARLRLGPPSAAAIDRMDEVLAWLMWVEPDEARLLWWRATRTPWKVIERRLGVCRTTAWRQWSFALIKIASRINALPKRCFNKKPCNTLPGSGYSSCTQSGSAP